jgi:hypothetical protein
MYVTCIATTFSELPVAQMPIEMVVRSARDELPCHIAQLDNKPLKTTGKIVHFMGYPAFGAALTIC